MDDSAEGSRSRRVARRVFSFLRPRPASDGNEFERYSRYSLPLIILLGNRVSFQPFLTEVRSEYVFGLGRMLCLQAFRG